MRLSARGLRLRLTVDLLWIPTRLVCNLRQAPGGTRHHNFMLCVVLAVPACTLASGWYRPFYKTETTETPMYVNRGGRLTILQEDQGQLLTLAGEPDGKLRAAGR